MSSSIPPTPRAIARRRLRRLSAAMLVIAIAAWLVCGLSYFVEWSTFTASAPRPRAPAAGSSPTLEGRTETHLMFGRGGLSLMSHAVHTESFLHLSADRNSRALAWATSDHYFPSIPPWRFGWYPTGPVLGVRLWLVAAVATVAWAECFWRLRRLVPEGHCAHCRYDLRGVVNRAGHRTICPECGSAFTG